MLLIFKFFPYSLNYINCLEGIQVVAQSSNQNWACSWVSHAQISNVTVNCINRIFDLMIFLNLNRILSDLQIGVEWFSCTTVSLQIRSGLEKTPTMNRKARCNLLLTPFTWWLMRCTTCIRSCALGEWASVLKWIPSTALICSSTSAASTLQVSHGN